MTNRELAAPFRELALVMEYLGESPFKSRSYARAYDTIRKSDVPLEDADRATLLGMPGVGTAISDKIIEYAGTGRLATLDRYRAQLPEGATELLSVRGLGPKKVRLLIDELGVSSVGELLHAIRENRVVAVKGFSTKTQEKLRDQLEFHERSLGRVRLDEALRAGDELLAALRATGATAVLLGELARQCPVITELEALATPEANSLSSAAAWEWDPATERTFCSTIRELPVRVRVVSSDQFPRETVRGTCAPGFAERHPSITAAVATGEYASERAVFEAAGLPYVPTPQRESESPWPPTPAGEVITENDIRGVVHAHTTWSDGAADIEGMAVAAREAGFAYLTITDHSRAAGYAGGLSQERLREQVAAIREVGRRIDGITLFAGTECDILRDGTLDYDDELLSELDIVVASVHSVLRMSEDDATARVLRAVANPHVDVLGHPTGRLLLSRPGYPLDMEAVLDACAEASVAVELNASPYRLDLDWRLIPGAVRRGIPVSINPDAHSVGGVRDIRYGVLAAQKAGLRASECLNARSVEEFSDWLARRTTGE